MDVEELLKGVTSEELNEMESHPSDSHWIYEYYKPWIYGGHDGSWHSCEWDRTQYKPWIYGNKKV